MNLQAYANHRKAQGLRGQSHVAVLNAIRDGRLSPPAVQRQGRSWIINAELADTQWAGRTDPGNEGTKGGSDLPIGPGQAASSASRQSAGASGKSGPPLAVSKQVKAAYDAKLAELEYKTRIAELVPAAQVRNEAFEQARAVRDSLLSLANRLAPILAATTDSRECHRLLMEEHRLALRGLADD
jgi:hypothetical protein